MSSTPRVMPPAKSLARKRGRIAFSMISCDDRVGERAFEPVADLDAHLALVRRHDQQHAVVLVLLADLPVAAELIAVILDRGALQRLQRDDDELVGGLGFEIGELLGRAPRASAASRMPASSTTRPVSAGKSSAMAGSDETAGEQRDERAVSDPRCGGTSGDRRTFAASGGGGRPSCAARRIASTASMPSAALPTRQNFTGGGRSTSSATVKVSIGLLLR